MMQARTLSVTESGRLGELYERHAPEALRLGYLITGDAALAEDLVHEAFVNLLGRFRDLRNPGAFHWYLRKTVVNLARSHFRHARVEREYVAREGRRPSGRTEADPVERDEMWSALGALSERQRAAIVLRYYEDLTEAQTAEVLGVRLGTVKSLVSRGIARLREEMGRDD